MKTHYITQGMPPEWSGVALVFTALGDDWRQRILLAFEPGERLSIKDIADALPLSRTAVVHHLGVLRDAGILLAEKSGRSVMYRLDESRLQWALDALRTYIQTLHPEQTLNLGQALNLD
jgi:DNA-binding transcriptional ArsR family regulator